MFLSIYLFNSIFSDLFYQKMLLKVSIFGPMKHANVLKTKLGSAINSYEKHYVRESPWDSVCK